jgi:hypothetical protein
MSTSVHRIIENLNKVISYSNDKDIYDGVKKDLSLSQNQNDFNAEIKEILRDLKSSVHFDIGDLEHVRSSDKNLNSLPGLPFEKTYLETKYEGKTYGCLFKFDGDLLVAKLFRDNLGHMIYTGLTVMYEQSEIGVKRIFDTDLWGDERDDSNEDDCLEIDGFVMCLHIMNCSNIEYVDHPPMRIMNEKRKKKGKQPLFTYKTLHIKSDKKLCRKAESKGNRQSPRAHLRRGHIRKLKTHSVWVQPCYVKGEGGFVHKDYAFN